MNKGLFIVFEGTDGTGKTTQAKILQKKLQDKGYNTLLLHEPGTTQAGLEIRKLVLNKDIPMDSVTQAMLFLAARATLVNEIIKPELERGTIIICDRFTASTLAYQGFASDKGKEYTEKLNEINKFILDNVKPDITFYLQGDPEKLLKRREKRNITDRFETKDISFQYKLKNAYDTIFENNEKQYQVSQKVFFIDAENKLQKVKEDITKVIDGILSQERN